jgi:hypothetical protein
MGLVLLARSSAGTGGDSGDVDRPTRRIFMMVIHCQGSQYPDAARGRGSSPGDRSENLQAPRRIVKSTLPLLFAQVRVVQE